ncbi:hypothetical protein TELCIR_25825, partial [Teladorsagia circumcincta]
MTHLLNLERRKLMAAALKELESNSGDVSFLSEHNKKILQEHDTIFQDAEKDSIEVLQGNNTMIVSQTKGPRRRYYFYHSM